MKNIKNFIYLDQTKMYSLSSQIFEGITEYLINSNESQKEDTEQQKGPVASGRILANIIKETDIKHEKKYLHDYSYTLFEDYLEQNDKVVQIDNTNVNEQLSKLNDYSFIKITGSTIFNDIKSLKKTLESYNKIGEALTIVSNNDKIEESKKQLELAQKATKSRDERLGGVTLQVQQVYQLF